MLKVGMSGSLLLQRAKRDVSLRSLLQYTTASRTFAGVTGVRSMEDKRGDAQSLHVTARTQYPVAKSLPLPNNLEDVVSAEKIQFSPHRERDISGPMIVCKESGVLKQEVVAPVSDPHLQSYDCNNSVSLTCTMQSNVPQPFSAEGKATHLNMPGGQWDRTDRWVSQDMQELHWRGVLTRRLSSTAGAPPTPPAASGKERLKAAVRDYGATVVVFHVSISLLSLGAFYTAVNSGVDVGYWIGKAGLEVGQVAAGASTFVVAYAIHKVFAPVRIGITLTSAPFIVRYLRSIGFLKPPKTT